MHGPVLSTPNVQKPFIVVVDACGLSIGVELSWDGHPIAFESHKLAPAELKHEKELTIVIHALKIWKHCLIGNEFIIEIDHQSSKYFLTQKKI